ncbi:MAG TPA: hypothetical protein VL125_17175 [Pelobium sp.]|nr:hypothetical protein [Pelobium sp.]
MKTISIPFLKASHILMVAFFFLILTSCKKETFDAVTHTSDQAENPEIATLATTVINVDTTTDFNSAFWTNINSLLNTQAVDIVFADGTYNLNSTINLNGVGNNTHRLQLKANTIGAAVFTSSIADSVSDLMMLKNCKNILLHRLKFTGGVIQYALRIRDSQNITIAYCRFVDLPNIGYGALGVHYAGSDNIIVRQNQFTNVGYNSQAHMIYAAWGATRLKVIDNQFTDCSGSYVRFRDNATRGVVYDNNFTSTGTYWNTSLNRYVNRVFVEVAIFNKTSTDNEIFGTEFMVANNAFNYSTNGDQSERFAFLFHHSGFNAPGRSHLTSADAALLGSGTVSERRQIMSDKLGLDGTKILYGNNTNVNVATDVSFRFRNDGTTNPWEGIVNITPAVNSSGLATSYEEALVYYDNLY